MLRHTALHRFALVYDARHVGRAAAAAGITQPAMSKSIAKLEEDLSLPLFVRTASALEPTPYADALRRHAQLIENEFSYALLELAAIHEGASGRLRVGVGPAWELTVLPPILISLHKRFPQIGLDMRVGVRDQLIPELREGTIDIWIGSLHGLKTQRDIVVTQSGRSEMSVFAAKDHPLAVKSDLTMNDLGAFDWACFVDDQHGIEHLDSAFSRAGVTSPMVVLRSSSVSVMFTMAASSHVLAYAADTLQSEARNRGLVRLDLAEPLWGFETGLACRSSAQQLVVVQHIIAMLRAQT